MPTGEQRNLLNEYKEKLNASPFSQKEKDDLITIRKKQFWDASEASKDKLEDFSDALRDSIKLLDQLKILQNIKIPTPHNRSENISQLSNYLRKNKDQFYKAHETLAIRLLSEKEIEPSESKHMKDVNDIFLLSNTIEHAITVLQSNDPHKIMDSCETLTLNAGEMNRRDRVNAGWKKALSFTCHIIALGLFVGAVVAGCTGFGAPVALTLVALGGAFNALGIKFSQETPKKEARDALVKELDLLTQKVKPVIENYKKLPDSASEKQDKHDTHTPKP
jgi:hypothetical protein